MGFYLGIDLGTTYFKAGIYDEAGRLCGLGREPVPKKMSDGRCELSVSDFWGAIRGCLGQALNEAKISAGDIAALSYSSQANSFVLLDKCGAPLTDLILWPDRRAADSSDAVRRLSGLPGFTARTGLGIDLNEEFMVAKLAWFQEHEPDIWSKTASVMTISDYLVYALTGAKVGDMGTASMTGLLDVKGRAWWPEALEAMGIAPAMLSKPLATGTLAGTVSSSGTDLTGLADGTEVFLGNLDHYAVAIGAGILQGRRISESTGTVLAAVSYSEGYAPVQGVITSPGLDGSHYFRLAFDCNGATAVEWYQKNYAPDKTILQLEEAARDIPAGCDGLTALPRSDSFPGLEGFCGIRPEHTPAHFLRAIFESTADTLVQLVDKLDPDRKATEVIPSGGGARNALWLEIKAGLLQRKYLPQASGELATKGAAMICPQGKRLSNAIKHTNMKMTKEDVIARARESIQIEAKAIADIASYLDEESFYEAVKALAAAPRITTCASGSSGIAAKKFAHSLCCIERGAQVLSPAEAVHGGMGCMKKGDVVVMVSRGGKTAELLPINDVCNKKGVTLIGVTENLNSILAQKSQIVVPMKIERESDCLNTMATTSYVVTIAIFDAMLNALMVMTDYTLEQFALIHPGGAVGAKLNN